MSLFEERIPPGAGLREGRFDFANFLLPLVRLYL